MTKQLVYSKEWLKLIDNMQHIVDESKMIQPSYFYLEILRRKERSAATLRWRARGTNGSSLVFSDPYMQRVLASLPVALQRKYVELEVKKVDLNQQAAQLRLLLSGRLARFHDRQLELQV